MREAWESVEPAAAILAYQGRSRRWAWLVCITAAVAGMFGAGLCAAAVLIHAPAPAVPLVAVVCVGCPVFASWELPIAIAALRVRRTGGDEPAIVRMRRSLDELPEIEHPLGY